MGQTWLAMYDNKIVGFITMSLTDVRNIVPGSRSRKKFEAFGNLPALLVSYLATHKDYERQGIGSSMILFAMKTATKLSKMVGCRFVVVRAEKNVVQFYKKLEFIEMSHKADKDGLVKMAYDIRPYALQDVRDN